MFSVLTGVASVSKFEGSENKSSCFKSLPVDLSKDPKVSVILTICDADKHIEQCLTYLQQQVLQDYEIIVLDVFNNGQSQMALDDIYAAGRRIKLVSIDREMGQGFARNEGIKIAQGEYIFFLDFNTIPASSTVLFQCVNEADKSGSDLVLMQEVAFDSTANNLTSAKGDTEVTLSDSYILANTEIDPAGLIYGFFERFLYRKSFIDGAKLKFSTPEWGGVGFIYKALMKANWISVLPVHGIPYRKGVEADSSRKLTPDDLVYMAHNIRGTGELYQSSSAGLVVTGMQYVQLMLNGCWARIIVETIISDQNSLALKQLSEAFDGYCLDCDSHLGVPAELLPKGNNLARVMLFLAALRLRKWVWVMRAITENPIDQADLFLELLAVPDDTAASTFQAALSLYARNDQIKTAPGSYYKGVRPRIVIHIGATKTGSTFIQHFLEKNRAALLREGVWYPEVGLFWQANRPHKQAGHALFTSEAVESKGRGQLHDHIEAGLSLAEGRIHTIILSSEAYFTNRNSVAVADHFPGSPVEMIGYFRRQDDWANSQYAESVAGGAIGRVKKPISRWLKHEKTRMRLNYFSYLELWGKKIGRNNVHARIYDRAAFAGGDVVIDFLTTIGLPELAKLPRPSVGQSNDFPFGTAHVLAMRSLNALPWKDSKTYLSFIDEVTKNMNVYFERRNESPGKVSLLSVVQRRKIMRGVAQSNRAMAKYYMGHENGVLFSGGASDKKADVDSLSVEEIDILVTTYRKYMPKSPANRQRALKVINRLKKINLLNNDRRFHRKLVYKFFKFIFG